MGGVGSERSGQWEKWTAGGVDSERSGQREQWTARGVDNGRSGQREEWTTGGVDSENNGHFFNCVFSNFLFKSSFYATSKSVCVGQREQWAWDN